MRNILPLEPPALSAPGRVMVVDDYLPVCESMADVLRAAGHEVVCCSSAAEALQNFECGRFDCLVTDLKMPGMSGIDLIIQVEQRRLDVQVVMVTAHASVTTAVEAMRHGAFDYIEKPFKVDQLERLVGQAIRHGRMRRPEGTDAATSVPHETPMMIGSSAVMQMLRARIVQIAPTPETVLITGESGTGKELVAQAVHAASDRRSRPWVSLNCPVLSAQLMESELFGHEKGAFTGAEAQRVGRFETADGGTLLLDEVTEIDLRLQAKLLRVLQERSFERVGSCQTRRVDVRVLATTNRDLLEEVSAGRFREDLYFRLAVVPLHVPPLRERREDVPELVEHFFRRAAQRLGRNPPELDASARQLLADYHWPGNVRELENIITRLSVLEPGKCVAADDLRRWLIAGPAPADEPELPVGISLEEMERKLIEATLERFGGHRAKTAQALGIGLRTLTGKLRQYGYAPRERSYSKAG
ncbi:MAG: sigma-54-dependent Fis family transcriptional regulator [Pirellulales bacterium]|nr:sigma-54-dependent Fis family transcriptional regulator [Pirellulales bacterium]